MTQEIASPPERTYLQRAPAPLTASQSEQFHKEGYVLVSGLIPPSLSVRAERAMWRCIGCDPDAPPASWDAAPGGLRLYNKVELKNCFTPACLAAAAQLTGDEVSTFSKSDTHPKTYHTTTYIEAQEAGEDLSRFYRWDCAYAVNIFPGAGEKGDLPHIDHAMAEHHHRSLPPVFRLGALIYLNDIGPHSGGTRVWPGSQRVLEDLDRSHQHYEWRAAIMADLPQIDLGEPLELMPHRGDVLFLHHLLAHAGSYNASKRPRFAINMKW